MKRAGQNVKHNLPLSIFRFWEYSSRISIHSLIWHFVSKQKCWGNTSLVALTRQVHTIYWITCIKWRYLTSTTSCDHREHNHDDIS